MTEAYGEEAGEPNTSPWVWDAAGQHMAWLAIQAAGAPFLKLLQCVPTSWRRHLIKTTGAWASAFVRRALLGRCEGKETYLLLLAIKGLQSS